jgi:hypothetical protein
MGRVRVFIVPPFFGGEAGGGVRHEAVDKHIRRSGLQKELLRSLLQSDFLRMPDLSAFSALPDDARVWIHAAAAPLSDATQGALLDRLSTFMEEWTSHQRAVTGTATVLYDRFLVVAASAGDGDISGCGIDDLTHAVDDAASALDIEWTPALHVLYRASDGSVAAVPRRTFQQRGEEGAVTPDTPVFDPSLTTLGALRDGQFEKPARESWHAQLLGSPAGT